LWGLGYVSDDASNEDYDSEELDEDEVIANVKLSDKIEDPAAVLDEADIEAISNNPYLLDKYRNRWWGPTVDAYFSVFTQEGNSFKAGEQLFCSYGYHSNSTYLEK
jgi:hypothetical protein